MEDIDPNTCGYVVDENTFPWILKNMMIGDWYTKDTPFYFWSDIQERANSKRDFPEGTEDFFAWFRTADLATIRKNAKTALKPRRRLFLKFSKYLPEPLYIPLQRMLLKTYLKNKGFSKIADEN